MHWIMQRVGLGDGEGGHWGRGKLPPLECLLESLSYTKVPLEGTQDPHRGSGPAAGSPSAEDTATFVAQWGPAKHQQHPVLL